MRTPEQIAEYIIDLQKQDYNLKYCKDDIVKMIRDHGEGQKEVLINNAISDINQMRYLNIEKVRTVLMSYSEKSQIEFFKELGIDIKLVGE